MTAHPGRLVASGVPQRADSSLEADWSMALIVLAWAEGHGACSMRPGPVPERPECSCGGLRFQLFRPVPVTAAGLAAVALPPAGTEAAR